MVDTGLQIYCVCIALKLTFFLLLDNPMLWNRSTSEFHLALIAGRIDDWRSISPLLGLSAVDDFTILGENAHSVPTQRVAMLRKWKQKQGQKATYKELHRVFSQCERADLADFVLELVTDSSKESELTNM